MLSRRLTAAGTILALSTACSGSPNEPRVPSATQQFSAALGAQGLPVVVGGLVPRSSTPYFSIASTELTISRSAAHGSEHVLVFEYEHEAAAAAEAARVRPDGQPSPTMMVSWVATPRFYRQRQLLVLYVGCDQQLLAALQSVIGAPFVTGVTPCSVSGL